MAFVLLPLHILWLDTVLTVGVGFTVTVNERELPKQLLARGVTVILALTGEVPVLIAVKELMLPVPFAPKPIDVVLLVQL
jgi:hypothetical protein